MMPGDLNITETYTSPEEFAFCLNGQLQSQSLFADVLFDGGKMKPLKLLPPSQYQHNVSNSPKSPRSPKRMLSKDVLVAPKHNKTDCNDHPSLTKAKKQHGQKSYLTISNMVSEQIFQKKISSSLSICSSNSSSGLSSRWSRKWKLTDLLTFRGSPDENANNKNGSEFIGKNDKKDMNEWSFRSDDSSKSSGGGGACRKKGRVSAHEWHYMKNRAATEKMRNKTFLPYKKSLLGCMDVDTGVLQISRLHGVEITC